MKYFKKLIKSLFIFVLSLMLAFTCLVTNTNEVNASGEYSLEVFYGLGRTPGSTNTVTAAFTGNGAMLNNNTGYSLKGYRDTAYTNGPSSGLTNRYDQAPQGSIASVDFYYGGSMLTAYSVVSSGTHCIKANFYLDADGNLKKTNDGSTSWPAAAATRLASFAAAKAGDSNAMASRWLNIPGAIDVVIHYSSGEHTITVNNVEDASFDNDLGEKYDLYYTTKENNSTSTTVSNNYTNANGIVQDVTLLQDDFSSVIVNVGSNAAATNETSGVQYLSSSYEFSASHNSNDILALDFDNNQIRYYKVNNDITISFLYPSETKYQVTFMSNGEQYGEVQEVYEGSPAVKPADPEIPVGYNAFVGWYLGDEEFNFSTVIDSDIVLEARFDNLENYDVNFYHGYGRSVYSTSFNGLVGNFIDGDYKYYGKTVVDGYEDTTGATYYQNEQAATSYVEVRYGDESTTVVQGESSNIKCFKYSFYVTSDGHFEDSGFVSSPSTTWPTGSTKVAYFASGNPRLATRWYSVKRDLNVIFHYFNEHTLTVNGILDTNISEDYDAIFTTKNAGAKSTSTIISNDYTFADGLVQNYTLKTDDDLASVTVNAGENVSTDDVTGIKYLTATNEFSDAKSEGDILAIDFDNNEIIYYVVNSNITVNFAYANDVVHNVLFMANGSQYSMQMVNHGDLVAEPVNPSIPEGYKYFGGWRIEGQEGLYDFNTPITDDLTLYAYFIKEHTITFINLGHNYDSGIGTVLGGEFVKADAWASVTGGELNKQNAVGTTYGNIDYEDGLEVEMNADFSAIDKINVTIGEDLISVSADALLEDSYFINSNYKLEAREAYEDGDILKFVKKDTLEGDEAYKVLANFYRIEDDVEIEFIYKIVHTIRVVNFGNASHNYIGTGKFAASGSEFNFNAWNPYGSGGNNLRSGGTINYSTGIATIYGDYSSTSGYGAALLIHEDYTKHDKVTITYNHGEGNEQVDYVTFNLDNVNGVNTNWVLDGVKVLQFVQNKNVEYYNVRFFNVSGDISMVSSGGITYTSSLKLNNDGTVGQDLKVNLGDYNENYVAYVDEQEVSLEGCGASNYQVKLPSLAPAKLIQERNVKIYDGSTLVSEKQTSAKEYLNTLIENYPSFATFAKSMLNYGAYCQIYFGENVENLANAGLDSEEIDVSSVTVDSDNDRLISGSTDGIIFYGQSLNLISSTKMCIYFQINEGSIFDYVFKEGGTVLTPSKYSDDVYFVAIRNVAAPDLDVKHTITVTKDDEGDLSVTASVLSYANTVINKYEGSEVEEKVKLVNLMKALYAYCQESKSVLQVSNYGLKQGWNNSLTMSSTYDIQQFDMPYQLYLPENYSSDKEYPVLFFLHGNGSKGTDNQKQFDNADIINTLINNPDYKDVIIIAPQYSSPRWLEVVHSAGIYELADEMTYSLQQAYNIFNYWTGLLSTDDTRYYLYGNSQGGFASYDLMARFPEKWAAAVVVAGCGDPNYASVMKDIPIWIHHGSADATVPYNGNVIMYNALIDAGAQNVKFTTYDGVGHTIFHSVGQNEEVAEWLMSQHK